MIRRNSYAVIALLGCAFCVGCGEEGTSSTPTEESSADSPTRTAQGTSSDPVDDGPSRSAAAKESHADTMAAPEPGGEAGAAYSSPDTEMSEATGSMSPSMPPSVAYEGVPADSGAPAAPQRSVAPPKRQPNRHAQSGTLTAGSFDDHERFEDYQQFLSEAMQRDVHEVLPRVERGHRVVIMVVDSQSRPLGDARVVVRQPGSQATLLDVTTAADGRAFFMGDRGEAGEFEVSITPPDGSSSITETIDGKQSPCRMTLPEAVPRLPRQLDLALVVDTTGSMRDELEYLKAEIDDIAETIHRMFPNVDQRYALILYRDRSDAYVTRCHDFTGSLSEFRSTLAAQGAQGGGDYPEAMHLALEQAGKLAWRDRDTARVLFLVGDAPPHDQFAGRTIEAAEDLRKQCVRVFPTAASGVQMKAEFIMRVAAFLTQGKYLFLTDHSGVGNPHAKPHVPDYQVEHLNRLMIRMIASELAGRNLAAKEVVAIEQGALPVSPGPWRPKQQGQQDSAVVPQQENHAMVSRNSEAGLFSSVPRWMLVAVIGASLFVLDVISGRLRP